MKKIFDEIKRANPDAKIIAFTTPTSQPLWELLLELNLLDYYCRWLGDIVQSYGEVYDFMGTNSITANLDNYRDANHFNPSVGTMIVDRIMNFPDEKIPDDFGRRITRENLGRHIAEMKQKYARVTVEAPEVRRK
jgi:hypothetical protein